MEKSKLERLNEVRKATIENGEQRGEYMERHADFTSVFIGALSCYTSETAWNSALASAKLSYKSIQELKAPMREDRQIEA